MSGYSQLMDTLVESSGLFTDNPDSIEHFDDRKFRFQCVMLNQDGYLFRIRKSAIKTLKITDSLIEWFHYGYLDVDNPDDIMERTAKIDLAEAFEKINVTPYSYRSDARDLLYIHIEPYVGEEDGVTPTLDNQIYTMKMLFTVYKTDDINSDTGASKGKMQRLYFHDYRYQSLLEKNTYYSTAKNFPAVETSSNSVMVSKKPITQQNNKKRSKPTGEIVQEIFRSVYLESDVTGAFAFDWDFGSTDILYTSPSDYRAIDDLNYVLDRHATDKGDPCILKLDRYTNKWSFTPLSNYFKRSSNGTSPGVLQSERFSLSFDGTDDPGLIPPERKSFNPFESNEMINYHFEDISIVEDYTFVEMDGTDCQLLLDSTAIVRYSDADKQYNIDLTQNNIANIREHFEQNYTTYLIGTNDGGATPSWLSDSSRERYFNFSVKESWTANRTGSLSVSRSKKLLSSVLLGNSIYFNSRGSTSRRSGVWITLDRDYEYIDSEYDSKVLGQYLVTRVEHVIEGGKYTNKIIGVKPYLFKNAARSSSDITHRDTNVVNND